MKHLLFAFTCSIAFFSFYSCSKSGAKPAILVVPVPPIDTVMKSDTTTDVYIAGYQNNECGYWKNSQFVALGPPNLKSYMQDLAFVGSDIYALGQSGDSLGYWKNGQFNLVTTNDSLLAVAISVSGTDVYSFYQDIYSGLWPGTLYKNSQFNASILTEINPGTVNMVAVGSDIYIPGTTESVPSRPAYWKNGMPVIMSAGQNGGAAFGIAVAGMDVLAVGRTLDVSGNYWVATLWKNGVPTYMSDSTSCISERFIQLSGQDIYIVGSVIPGTQLMSGTTISTILWKNGVPTILTPAGDQDTPVGLAVDGSDVYVSVNSKLANGKYVLRYYKNGIPTTVTEETNAGGQRIFIKRR